MLLQYKPGHAYQTLYDRVAIRKQTISLITSIISKSATPDQIESKVIISNDGLFRPIKYRTLRFRICCYLQRAAALCIHQFPSSKFGIHAARPPQLSNTDANGIRTPKYIPGTGLVRVDDLLWTSTAAEVLLVVHDRAYVPQPPQPK